MSNLKIYGQEISSHNLDKKSVEVYVSHFSNTKIKNYEDKNIVKDKVKIILNNTFAYKGQSPNSEREYGFILVSLQEDLLNNFNDYTIQDVKLSFAYGVRGELGEYFGLNGKTFYDWLKNYKSKILNPTIQKVAKLKPVEKSEVDSEAIYNNYISILSDSYKKFLETQIYSLFDYGNMIYNFLDKNKVIQYTKEEKFEMMNQAKHIVKNMLIEDNKHKKSLGKDFQILNLEKAFRQIENNESHQKEIIIESKRVALKRFFDDCLSKKITLDEFINLIKSNKND